MSNGNGADIAARQAKEIDDIIAKHHAREAHLEGHELLAVRRELSIAIREACERHRAELMAPPKEADA